MLKWIVEQARGTAQSIESPLGWVPRYEDVDWRGIDFSPRQFDEVMGIDRDSWQEEISSHDRLFIRLYDKLPKEFILLRELILSSLWRAPARWALEPE